MPRVRFRSAGVLPPEFPPRRKHKTFPPRRGALPCQIVKRPRCVARPEPASKKTICQMAANTRLRRNTVLTEGFLRPLCVIQMARSGSLRTHTGLMVARPRLSRASLAITKNGGEGGRTDFSYDEQGRKTSIQYFDPKVLERAQNSAFSGSSRDAAVGAGIGVPFGGNITTCTSPRFHCNFQSKIPIRSGL